MVRTLELAFVMFVLKHNFNLKKTNFFVMIAHGFSVIICWFGMSI